MNRVVLLLCLLTTVILVGFIHPNSITNKCHNEIQLKLEITSNGLFLNSKNISNQTNPEYLRSILGQPDSIYLKKNTIWVYDNMGLKIYFNPVDSFLKSVEFDYIKGDLSFSPKNSFSGTFIIFGINITNSTSLSDLKQIKELMFEESFSPIYYTAKTSKVRLDFSYFTERTNIGGFGISFKL